MTLKPIRTESDYADALRRVESLMGIGRDSKEADEFEILVTLIGAYEREHYPIGLPDPIEAIRFRMEQQGLEPKDLTPLIGSRSKVSEVLARKRPLSLRMIRALSDRLGIPAEVLLQAPSHKSDIGSQIEVDAGTFSPQFTVSVSQPAGWGSPSYLHGLLPATSESTTIDISLSVSTFEAPKIRDNKLAAAA